MDITRKNRCVALYLCTSDSPYNFKGDSGACDCDNYEPSDDSPMSLCKHYAEETGDGEFVNICRSSKAQNHAEDYYETH